MEKIKELDDQYDQMDDSMANICTQINRLIDHPESTEKTLDALYSELDDLISSARIMQMMIEGKETI